MTLSIKKSKLYLGGGLTVASAMALVTFALANGTGPSAFCHETDGLFTNCDPATPEPEEWSDIEGTPFAPGTTLYVDQADKHPTRSIPNGSGIDTLMLMYDEVQRTVPLLPGESVHVHFMTVEEGELIHYDVFIDSSGIQKVLINDVEQVPMPTGLSGIAGFGPSPNSAVDHVMAELQIGLEAAGFTPEECCYSPDPAWWGSDVPTDPQTPEGEPCLPRQGDGTDPIDPRDCVPGKPEQTTSAIFTANIDGTTTVVPTPLRSPGDEPPQAACIETVNPHGKTVPPAGSTTLPGAKGGQNEDGFYLLLASQDKDKDLLGSPRVWVEDTGSGKVFGPFKSGNRIKYTEANGATPNSKNIGSVAAGNAGQSDAIAAHITGTGDAAVFATAADDEASAKVFCRVPPPLK